jgi:outer membrane protein assembly factor BamB
LYSCKEEPQPYIPEEKDSIEIIDGAIYKTPYLWKVKLTDSDHKNGWVFQDIKYNNGFLTFITENKILYLALINYNDGSIIWKEPRKIRWEGSTRDDGIDLSYQYNRYLVNEFVGIGEYGYECIDLETGKQLWETNTKEQGIWINNIAKPNGLDSLFFFVGRPTSLQSEFDNSTKIYCGNVITGAITELPFPTLIDSVHMDSLKTELVMPYRINNKIELLVGYSAHKNSYIAVYDYQSSSWKRKNISVRGEIFTMFYYYNKDRFIVKTLDDSATVICGNLQTTEINWTRNDLIFTTNIVEVGNNFIGFDIRSTTTTTEFMALNKYTGKTEWSFTKSQPEQYVYKLNNYVYFYSGLLYGLNGLTGEQPWHLKPNDGGRFTQIIMLPGENGAKDRIIGCSGQYAYCYEALNDKNKRRYD